MGRFKPLRVLWEGLMPGEGEVRDALSADAVLRKDLGNFEF
jgi:hypothetical protein